MNTGQVRPTDDCAKKLRGELIGGGSPGTWQGWLARLLCGGGHGRKASLATPLGRAGGIRLAPW